MRNIAQSGSVLPFVAIALPVLVGFMGLVVDFGNKYQVRADLQNVADAVALACVKYDDNTACCAGTCTSGTKIIGNTKSKIAAVNPKGYTVNTEYTAVCPDSEKQSYCASVNVATSVPNYFLFNLGETSSLSVSAMAGKAKSNGPCLYTAGAVNINGGNTLELDKCSGIIGGKLTATKQCLDQSGRRHR